MTRTYLEAVYRWPSYEAYNRGEISNFSHKDREYSHSIRWHLHIPPLDNKHLFISREENGETASKSVIVEDCYDYIYSILKTKVKARGGNAGLFKFLDDSLFKNSLDGLAWHCIKTIWETTKDRF